MKQWWNRVMKQWWNSDETCWIRMNQQWNNLLHGRETPWIMLNQDEWAMKQFVSWSWNTVKHVESGWNMVMKHLESGWNSVFHGHETHFSCQWNTLNQGRRPQRYLFSYIDFWFLVFHCVSLCCFIAVSLLFHAVSLPLHAVSCCFTVFHCAVSCCFIDVSLLFHCCCMLFHCCFTVFHRSVSWCFKVFHCPVSSCFMTMKQVRWERALIDRANIVIASTESLMLPFDYHIYIWPWPIIKVKVKVKHISTVNIAQTMST